MGNTNTSLVNQASASSTCCLVIEPQSVFPRGNRGLVDTTKPPGLNVDDVCWAEVVEAIDPLARRLNTGFCTVLVLYIAIIGAFGGLGAAGVIQQYNEDGPSLFLILVWASIPLYLGTIMYIYEVQNRRVDNQIRQLMEGWKYRFEESGGEGCSLDYRLQHARMLKPGCVRSERLLAFVPIESDAEVFSDEPTDDTNTSIDIEIDAGRASSTQKPSLVDRLQQDDRFC